jgi:hypothetical protein
MICSLINAITNPRHISPTKFGARKETTGVHITAPLLFGYLSGLVNIPGYPPYIRDVLKGTTKPERATWCIWSVLGLIAFFSQLAEGATHSLWLTGVQTVGVVGIFSLSIWKGEGGLTGRDIVCLGLASLGVGLWYVTRHAAYAICLVIVVDLIGAWLTIRKTYISPGSETLVSWMFSAAAGLFSILAVTQRDWAVYAYPVYNLLVCTSIVAAIMIGKRIKVK